MFCGTLFLKQDNTSQVSADTPVCSKQHLSLSVSPAVFWTPILKPFPGATIAFIMSLSLACSRYPTITNIVKHQQHTICIHIFNSVHYDELPKKGDYYRFTSRTVWRAMTHSHLTDEKEAISSQKSPQTAIYILTTCKMKECHTLRNYLHTYLFMTNAEKMNCVGQHTQLQMLHMPIK